MKVLYDNEHSAKEGLRRGDPLSLTFLFNHYHQQVFGFALRLTKSNDIAEEIVQEVFLRLWNKRDSIKLDTDFSSFIFTIARNLALDHFRSLKSKQNVFEELTLRYNDSHNNTEDQILYEELQHATSIIINSLPDQQKRVFQMSREKGMSYHEIAAALKISVNTVKVHLHSALQTLRKNLSSNLELVLMLLLFY